jgi:hypothetical protein
LSRASSLSGTQVPLVPTLGRLFFGQRRIVASRAALTPARAAALLGLGLGCFAPSAWAAGDGSATPGGAAEEAPLKFTVDAESEGRWRMALENTGDAPLRVLADARMVWLEVVTAPVEPDETSKKKAKPKAYPKGKIPVCRAPADLRPSIAHSDRWVVLQKGERVVEHFDPVLLCGASAAGAGLTRGALVYPHYGTPPDAAMLRALKQKKPVKPKGPFVVEPAGATADAPFLRDVEAPSLAIAYEMAAFSPESFAAGGGPGRPAEDLDERAPRLQLTAPPHGDAATETDVSLRVVTKNVGLRSATIHLRPDDYAFSITPPDGPPTTCGPGAASRGAARDFFTTMSPGSTRTETAWLRELCAGRTFSRPGVYLVAPRLVLREDGRDYGLSAFTGDVTAPNPTRIRVRSGRLPFHVHPPLVRKAGEPDDPPPPAPPPPPTAPPPSDDGPAAGDKSKRPDSGAPRPPPPDLDGAREVK